MSEALQRAGRSDVTWPASLLDGTRGMATVYRVAARRERAHRVFAAIQATVNLLLVASGRWPEKKGL